MARKVVAGLLVVAGLGVLAGALTGGSVLAQTTGGATLTGAGTNACCVRASTIPVSGGACGILQGSLEGTKKDLFCNFSPACPPTITTLGGTKEAPVVSQALFADATQNGGCVRQGLKVCNTGSTIGLVVRRGIKKCESAVAKIVSPANLAGQVPCFCVFAPQGASIVNVPNCTGSLCN
jgi:hypothetical protein